MDKFSNVLKIGEVSRLLGLTPETLRYFDKEGIVVPHKADNNYRYYNDWEINYLIEYKKYRGYGFSKKETKDILYNYSYEELLNSLKKNDESLSKRIQHLQLVAEKNQNSIERLEKIKDQINVFSFVEMEEMYYFKFRYNNQYFYDSNNEQIYQEWISQMPLVDPVLVITEPNTSEYYCGLAASKKYVDFLNLPTNDNVLYKAGGLHLSSVVIAGNKNTFSTALLNPTYAYIDKHGYHICGPIIGYYRARVHNNGSDEYRRYIEIYVPIEKN